MTDAQRAGLSGKKVWQQYPRHMLRHRALVEAASMACPDVALGLDVGMSSLDEPETRDAYGTTVVQVAQDVPQEPITAELVEVVAPEIPEPTEALCTGAQLRKIGALIGDLEKVEGVKYDRDGRRRLIGWYAGVDNPETLETAKDLTFSQASQAIDAITDVLATETVEAELVDEPTQETLT